MLIYIITRQHESGIWEYLGVEVSRKLAEDKIREIYPDLKRDGPYEDTYKSDDSNNPKILRIHSVMV